MRRHPSPRDATPLPRTDGRACARRFGRQVVRMGTENPSWVHAPAGCFDHRVPRSTIATIRKQDSVSPRDERPKLWQAVVKATLECTRRGGLLHDGGLDPPRAGYVLHRARHRVAVGACLHSGVDAHGG
jgi:hypothetical protein